MKLFVAASLHRLLFVCLISLLTSCSNQPDSFSRMATLGNIQIQAQQISPATGLSMMALNGSPVLVTTQSLNLGSDRLCDPHYGFFLFYQCWRKPHFQFHGFYP